LTWQAHPNLEDAKVRYHWDDGHLVRQVQQDAEPLLDANQRERNDTQGWNATRTMKKVASIPASLYYDWVVEWQMKGLLPEMWHPEFSKRANELCRQRVRDSDWSGFRL
jgi:hypothetical protein